MEQSYKGHNITASAWELLDKREWEPKVKVTWCEGIRERIKYPQITNTFQRTPKLKEKPSRSLRNGSTTGSPTSHRPQHPGPVLVEN